MIITSPLPGSFAAILNKIPNKMVPAIAIYQVKILFNVLFIFHDQFLLFLNLSNVASTNQPVLVVTSIYNTAMVMPTPTIVQNAATAILIAKNKAMNNNPKRSR